jgi:predicted Zn-dependent protease
MANYPKKGEIMNGAHYSRATGFNSIWHRIQTFAGILVVSVSLVSAPTAYGLTVKEEEDLSREVLQVVFKQYKLIDDPVINGYVDSVGRRIVATLTDPPFTYHFYVIQEDVYNAFATPAGHIFVNSGLFAAMDSEEELAGILAHEVSHVACRHISQKIEQAKKLNFATLAGVAAGVLLGVAGGGAQAAQALTMGSMAATQSAALAYSRQDEMQADQVGLQHLTEAGYNADGLLTILKKIRDQQWFGTDQVPTYLMTHPGVDDRIAYIDSWMAVQGSKARKTSLPRNEDAFDRAHIELLTRYGDERSVLQQMQNAVKQHPDDPMAHYHYGLILARINKREEAIEQIRMALEKRAFDPYILSDLGRIYFLDGKYNEALNLLQSAQGMIPEDPECLFYLGRTQMELGDAQRAGSLFADLTNRYPDFQESYYFLGQSLGMQGKMADAHYTLGLYYLKKGDSRSARTQLQRALTYADTAEEKEKINKLLKTIKPERQIP